ncbi:MAG TPA: hydantoinase/carbamoylase family amidase, partial [Solirubrobacterales bacterium]|nr:hydantoinase/carbamoylase family amidase [Solirubrobacterales bacterium]
TAVPGGGPLDGALGVLGALAVLRAVAAGGTPAHTLALVDWVDEEGRFGRSLYGSAAAAGTLELDAARELTDTGGRRLAEVLAEHGIELERVHRAGARLRGLDAYLELHIEQGPVLEAEGLPVAAVRGCAGVERKRLRFAGQAAHAGTTPMSARNDAGLAAAETALTVERVAVERGGVGTTGGLVLEPGIATAVPGRAELLVDLRHPDAAELEAMLGEVRVAAGDRSSQRDCSVDEERIWRIEPIPFDPALVELAAEAAAAAGGRTDPLTSGALHDAAEVARVLPAAMMFCPSRAGLSHTVQEDTAEADLATAIDAYGELVGRALLRAG